MKQDLFIILVLSIVLCAPFVLAEDITFTLNQKDYYFNLGEEAIINLYTNNTYDQDVSGSLTYTITQSSNQGGMQFSSSNTQSTSFSVPKGDATLNLDFGTSKDPVSLATKLTFSYTKDDPRQISLDQLTIHFVANDSQKNSQNQQVSSSSQQASQSATQSNDPFAEQQQKMQQMIDQMMGNQQQGGSSSSQQQTQQQRLQNSQLSQDSSALKQQMQKQLDDQEQMKQEFQKSLSQNPDFQQAHQELLDEGYNLSGANVNPSSNSTGNFDLHYEAKDGQQASLSGSMQNGQIQNLQKDSQQQRRQMLDKLEQNEQFQEYERQLKNEGFSQEDVQFNQKNDATQVDVGYRNELNQTASIQARIQNETVTDVELVSADTAKKSYWWVLFVLFLIVVISLLVFIYIKRRRQSQLSHVSSHVKKSFDYVKESKNLLALSRVEFEDENYKDAYGHAAQALRLFLSYDHDLRKEITNDDLLFYLRKNKKEVKKAKECFDLCSLVEFAKYEANAKDFKKIVSIINDYFAKG